MVQSQAPALNFHHQPPTLSSLWQKNPKPLFFSLVMAVKLAGRVRKRSCTERDEQVEQGPSNSTFTFLILNISLTRVGKRRRGAESGEKFEPSRQSPRLRRRSVESKPRPTRESPRLRERRDLNQQPAVRPASSSPRTVETRYSSKQKRTGPTSKSPPGRKYC
jgi:hypothetical protein